MAESPEGTGPSDLDTEVMLRSRGRHTLHTSGGLGSGEADPTSEEEDRESVHSVNAAAEALLEILSRDMLACDVQFSLFVGAAGSYRHDSSLAPFPPAFRDAATGHKDIKGVHEAIQRIPALSSLRWQLEQQRCQLSLQQLQLLLWVLQGGQSQLSLRTVERAETLARVGVYRQAAVCLPSHILAVRTRHTDRWLEKCQGESTFYAFHGSRFDNWFSILNSGIQQHRGKTSLFGEGIYLSSELGVSLNFSSQGVGWDQSVLGPTLSCVAVAQVIHHPSVKIHSECPVRGRVEGSEGGSIPENYILVRDNQLLNVRYILVYGNERVSLTARNRFIGWLNSHRLLLLLAGYGLLLLLVGLSSSTWFKRVLRKYGYTQ